MRFTLGTLAILFAFAVPVHAADVPESFQHLIINAYNDPQVREIVTRAQANHQSVTADLSEDSAIALGGDTEVAVEANTPPKKDSITKFGGMIDVGIPDGAGVNFVYRPWKWLRVFGGVTYNGVAPGLRGGVTLGLPYYFPVLPTLTIEGGHAFEGNANWIARKISGDESIDNVSLKRVSYDYATGELGLEFGAPNRFVFYVHAGLSYIHTTIHDFQDNIDQPKTSSPSAHPTITANDPDVNLFVPTGKLGFLIYFW